jgi:hypothetical protein
MPTNQNRRTGDAAARQECLCNDEPVTHNRTKRTAQAPLIRAELRGDNVCIAERITATGSSPVLALCRTLIEAGYDPQLPLDCYRGSILALRIRTIGKAAALEINGKGTGLIKCRAAVGTAPHTRFLAQVGVGCQKRVRTRLAEPRP